MNKLIAFIITGLLLVSINGYTCTTEESQSVSVNQYFSGYFHANIREIFRLDSSCNGHQIISVTAYMKSVGGYSQAQLALDGTHYGPTQQIVSSATPLSYTFYTPKNGNEIGKNFGAIHLLFRGNIYIERFEVQMEHNNTAPIPPTPVEEIFLGKIDTKDKPGHQTNIIPVNSEKKFIALSLKANKADYKIDTIEVVSSSGTAYRSGAILVKEKESYTINLDSISLTPELGASLQEIRIRGGNKNTANNENAVLEVFGNAKK